MASLQFMPSEILGLICSNLSSHDLLSSRLISHRLRDLAELDLAVIASERAATSPVLDKLLRDLPAGPWVEDEIKKEAARIKDIYCDAKHATIRSNGEHGSTVDVPTLKEYINDQYGWHAHWCTFSRLSRLLKVRELLTKMLHPTSSWGRHVPYEEAVEVVRILRHETYFTEINNESWEAALLNQQLSAHLGGDNLEISIKVGVDTAEWREGTCIVESRTV
ncbi:hypothetical protein EV356DRAFT_506776 [Viridothelium virens]|uniref:F-box domain-containing protein n=1 Tax=Viridothelium virens TaxID=1048519 RepID=A0A6A6H1V9_VIRVR|nr:hypothetical protein EV356DRAFT_506776 [Viridothelium virens]